MQWHLLLLFLFSQQLFISTIIAYSTTNKPNNNQKNASINIDLHQCNTKNTNFNSTIITDDQLLNNLIDSCSINCCQSNTSNICQVTVRSSTNICLGRLCYSDKCENFSLLSNMTRTFKSKNKTSVINTLRSSFGTIPWSSIANSTQTKLTSLINQTSGTIGQIILILMLAIGISLTFATLILILKSIRHATMISSRESYRYTLL
ncbi:hypothetical protein I4U23_006427 [Adineta vaga]|nr:hypothetical protein I4U23_006427 [Adineta vaga]